MGERYEPTYEASPEEAKPTYHLFENGALLAVKRKDVPIAGKNETINVITEIYTFDYESRQWKVVAQETEEWNRCFDALSLHRPRYTNEDESSIVKQGITPCKLH